MEVVPTFSMSHIRMVEVLVPSMQYALLQYTHTCNSTYVCSSIERGQARNAKTVAVCSARPRL